MAPLKSLKEVLQEAFEKADSLDAPLRERLKFYLGESRKLLPELESAYDQLVQRIAATEAEKHVPVVGEMMPDFIMPDSEGNLVDLGGSLPRGRLSSASIAGRGAIIAGLSCVHFRVPTPRSSPRAATWSR